MRIDLFLSNHQKVPQIERKILSWKHDFHNFSRINFFLQVHHSDMTTTTKFFFCVSSDGINNYFHFNIKLSLSLSSVDCCYFVRKESKRRGLSRKFVRWKMQMRLFYFLLFLEMNKWSERSRVQCEVFHLSTLLRLFISCECR